MSVGEALLLSVVTLGWIMATIYRSETILAQWRSMNEEKNKQAESGTVAVQKSTQAMQKAPGA